MKCLFLTAVACSMFVVSFGQASEVPTVSLTNNTTKKHLATNIFFEVGGPGLASFNIDMRFNKTQRGLGGRIGIGGIQLYNSLEAFLLPIGINYLAGKTSSKNLFEFGANITYINSNEPLTIMDRPLAPKDFVGTLCFGYRYQPADEGLTFRAALNPIVGHKIFYPGYYAISLGYKF